MTAEPCNAEVAIDGGRWLKCELDYRHRGQHRATAPKAMVSFDGLAVDATDVKISWGAPR